MKLYNTMTKQKDEFIPIEPGKVRMYVCGPTVYNFFHIGNARPFLMFDAFRRYLEYRGYEVTYVQNFTDVDDKIIKKANEDSVSSLDVSELYIAEYFKDADALGIHRATHHPKVTETMDEIISFIKDLEDKGFAYEIDGNVYFAVSSFKPYGKLSRQSLEDLEAGARIDISEEKRNPMDFALWKKKKEGEPAWMSPWGEGRPGWHIECSVMSTKYLGETIDIHAGGQDLIFPHHENEIAQSEAKTGKRYVNYWMHNGYINIENQKMSKSLNNFFTTREILESFDPDVVRFFMLSAHYRNPINFSRTLLESAKNGLDRLYTLRNNLEYLIENASTVELKTDEAEILKVVTSYKDKFIEVMDDDFNSADGISVIFELTRYLNTVATPNASKDFLVKSKALFEELTNVLGIVQKERASIDDQIEALIEKRQNARKNKDFALADQIRDELKQQGIILEDTPQGVKWHREA
ncbi:cysteine--tRNA ligase [Fusibacter ferrireducens]|uniref:Cysteine--tRNA ligase n=1 Tax=Fusibacter ferrireducens TaxID=2785058 RepID=A0ABS0A205_9FIRM|nr:cysteine--tRNA ligase [Fusibacter ferrireducens]MBF4695869.1 cysteine--tRNA ligase [Fusibacter ferrireducens]